MFDVFFYYVGNGSIEINGEVFRLGELSTEAMNISREEYRELSDLQKSAAERLRRWMTHKSALDWRRANEEYLRLDERMMKHRLFRVLKQHGNFLVEAQRLLDGKEDFPARKVDAFRKGYRRYCENYAAVLEDLASFNDTMYYFVNYFLGALKKMDSENYAAALYEFLYGDAADKMIANPMVGTGCYLSADPVRLMYIPRETEEGSDKYRIYEYYEAQMLQTLLKTDLYKGLESGHVIRRCRFCGRYFLLTKGYHTKYCDQPNPDDPRFTCAQLGYRIRGVKEAAGDNPKAQSLVRCFGRIEKDCSRGVITAGDKERLMEKARDLFHSAQTKAGVTYEEFEEQLKSKNLYPLCGVQRAANPRGRPKDA